jgi:DNA topoisomerase-1
MKIAQQLYEGVDLGEKGPEGLITYMRTDSLNLAQEFLKGAASFIKKQYGNDYAPSHPRKFKTKTKVAQEAHEAIRPTDAARTPEDVKEFLDPRQYKIYKLIWSRTIASQMNEAKIEQISIKIEATADKKYLLNASGSRVLFNGFLKVYPVKSEAQILPQLKENESLNLVEVKPDQHFTQPPPRYSEGTLVKTLEKFGIGRPSTYAPIIFTLQQRKYVRKDKNRRFLPTEVGIKVTELLSTHFQEIVDINFTAKMEDDLDKIANGKKNWVKLLKTFYGPFEKNVIKKEKEISRKDFTQIPTDEKCEKCGKPMVIKLGRFGKFLACSGFPDCKTTKPIHNTIGIKCPKCQKGDVVERLTKKGRVFYGCTRWPNCDFASWSKPTGDLCPECGTPLVEGAKDHVRCPKKECGYKTLVETTTEK